MIIISPAKNLNISPEKFSIKLSKPQFNKETDKLVELLKRMSSKNLKKLMNISESLANLNFERFVKFNTRDSVFKPAAFLFSGDTLLINGTGRTDFQNGNSKDAYNSIFNKLLKLPDETLLYPAHDYKGEKVSTIGKEKKYNPRLQVESVDEYIEIMNNLDLKKPVSIEENISKNLKLGA